MSKARIMDAVEQGDPGAAQELLPLVYDELRRLAAHKMAHEAPSQTIQATALVHEAWLRLAGSTSPAGQWNSRGHFFAAAAEAMRRILIERARRHAALKRGAGAEHVNLDDLEIQIASEVSDDVLEIHEALENLAAAWPRKAELVKLRYFAGLTFEEAAAVLNIAVPTAKEWWAHARAWLAVDIKRARQESAPLRVKSHAN